MRNRELAEVIGKVTDGVIGTLTDFLLLTIYNLACTSTVRTMYDADRAINDAHRMLDTVNYQTIKKTIALLSRKGMVATSGKHSTLELAITKAGLARINELIPTYKKERPWDTHIYLISYDIPKPSNYARDMLREYIRKTGGALLQESLWINPYNPTVLVERYVRDHDIPGTVLVSKLGSDGAIGDESLPELINRVYKLDELTKRYLEFLSDYPLTSKESSFSIRLAYSRILNNDPQLPFPLEPKGFPAKSAWERYQDLTLRKWR